MSFKEFLNEGKTANIHTQRFIELMLDEDAVFNFINHKIYNGQPDFIKTASDKIYKFLTGIGAKIDFDLDKVQSGWVFNQLELGGLEKTNFKKDFSDAL